jgi:hypothetical protein
MNRELASQLAHLALSAVEQPLPHKIDHVVTHEAERVDHRELHPAFYGAFDWHSAVHGHWTLVRLLALVPDLPEASEIERVLDTHLTVENMQREAEYCAAHPAFERMYGWAWLLELARVLRGTRWSDAIAPLADVIVGHYLAFLPKQAYPIRTGTHNNTAFGLAFAFDYAQETKHHALSTLIEDRARTYFAGDVDAPAMWEPGGDDFLSPVLVEADLMQRVLSSSRYAAWLHAFLPILPAKLREPATVGDRSDGKLAHLEGLNLSRAWHMRNICAALSPHDLMAEQLAASAELHAREGLAHVATGDYAGEHWLASFALLAATAPGAS